MRLYHELCIYAVCGVLTASAMRVWCKEGEIKTTEMIIIGILWPIFAMLLAAAFIIKMFEK